MFEEIVDLKFQKLKSVTGKLKVISPEEIKKSDLPVHIINFLYNEQPEIHDINTLNSLLEKYVKLSVNYTLRPKWTLVNYLFAGYDSKPAEEIISKVETFQFYRYYIDLITNHIKDNALLFITQEDVKALTDDANKVVLEKLVNGTSGVKIKNFFSHIYKLKYGEEREINLDWSVPFLFIKLFLEDKSFQNLIDKFKIIPGLDDTMEIEMKTAIKVLTNKYYISDDFFILKDEEKSPKTEIGEIESRKNIEQKTEKRKIENDKPEEKEKDEKIEISFDKEKEKKAQAEKENKTDDEDDKPKGLIRIIKNIPTKKFQRERKEEVKKEEKFAEAEETLMKEEKESFINPDGSEKIKYLFKEDEKNAILKKVFKGSKSYMEDTFSELEKFKTWDEASEFLKELFKKNKVSLYNKRVVLFIDILNEHFIEKEKGK